MKTIKFTKNVLVHGSHCDRGSVLTLDAATAALLVADGSAIYFVAPAPKVIEEPIETLPAPKPRKK
jgi:hypothetical protein